MKLLYLLTLLLFSSVGFALDLGGAISIDYYNNPIEDSAPSPIQNKLVLFYNMDKSYFNLRAGFGVLEGMYHVNDDDLLVFNDYYSGISTVEFDAFIYPGVLFPITNTVSLGGAGAIGGRFPIISKIDDGGDDAVDAFSWFYSDMHYLFWGGQIFSYIKLPLGDSAKLFISINYNNFINRDDQWTLGATTGMLWHL